MKTITSFLFLLLLVSLDTYAQKHLFRMFRFESSQLYDIDLTKPKGFKVIKGMTMFKVNKKNSIGTAYQLALESKAKDCLILSSLCMFKSHELMAKNMFYGELESALNIFVNRDMRLKLVDGKFMIQGTSNQLPANNTHQLDSAKYITISTFTTPVYYKHTFNYENNNNLTYHPASSLDKRSLSKVYFQNVPF